MVLFVVPTQVMTTSDPCVFSLHVQQDVKACYSQGKQTTSLTRAFNPGDSACCVWAVQWQFFCKYRCACVTPEYLQRAQITDLTYGFCLHPCLWHLLQFLTLFSYFFLFNNCNRNNGDPENALLGKPSGNACEQDPTVLAQLSILMQLNILPKSITSLFYSKHE